ncbi:kinesin family protein [Paecilomyces variotii No. 5]|uniref:Kinesin family protein n=1 Tax=Byssochlamys spectabilis (strain No. 5 / NBRC 109023) TaxID=1356009 RepID=V5I1U5_BYSSN|nr:kinesin family protein [Paecilomyces variotii No. 5]
MNPPPKQPQGQTSLFQVYLRLRPPIFQQHGASGERYLNVEPPEVHPAASGSKNASADAAAPTHITLQPPNDSRKRAVEKFGFTKVFEENASQLDLFQGTGMVSLVKGVLREGRDGLVATLGCSGSGKSHTILGSKSQRGMTQMMLDVLFRSLAPTIRNADAQVDPVLLSSLTASDTSEAQLFSAAAFLESIYGDPSGERGRNSRAQTPMSRAQTPMTDTLSLCSLPRRHMPQRPSALPQLPDVSDLAIDMDPTSEHVVIVSMYEVYNDRIFDLLSPMPGGPITRPGANQKDKRRPLLFKPTGSSPDRKVVAGLRKIVCSTYEEALMVLETGLIERKVAGTGSNSVSSRSHGFFCLEVKRKVRGKRYGEEAWAGNTLTVVDLAGSERARAAKTAGATLAEGGKINESLMYLGQCLQMQSDIQDGNKTALVPFRQCKLTELLFSNSFPSHNASSTQRYPQKGVMIVTADPMGDFNAMSQILRYSALAREVAVPRVPSVASTILSSSAGTKGSNGRTTPQSISMEELENAAQEIVRITNECETLAVKLAEEEIARQELEMKLRAAEERCLMIEQDVREECWAEMDERMEEERSRWQLAWDEQVGRHDQHIDKKIELISREVKSKDYYPPELVHLCILQDIRLVYEDPEPSRDEKIEELERENDGLHAKIAALERELMSRSPTQSPKKSKSKKNTMPNTENAPCRNLQSSDADIENALRGLDCLKLADNSAPVPATKSTAKKQRKMTTRKWDLAPEDEI